MNFAVGFNPRITVAPNHFPSRQRRLNSTVNANPLCIRTVAPTFLCVGEMPVLFGDIQPRSVGSPTMGFNPRITMPPIPPVA